MKREVEVEDGLLNKLGEVDLLPEYDEGYLYSLTMIVSEFLTATTSVSPRDISFLERGRLRIATVIFGCYIFKL
jgi:hypothetical protein